MLLSWSALGQLATSREIPYEYTISRLVGDQSIAVGEDTAAGTLAVAAVPRCHILECLNVVASHGTASTSHSVLEPCSAYPDTWLCSSISTGRQQVPATLCMLSRAAVPHQTSTCTQFDTRPTVRLQSATPLLRGLAGSPAAASSRHGAGSENLHAQPRFRCPASTPCAGFVASTAAGRCLRATRHREAAWQRHSGIPHAAADMAWQPADTSQPRWARNVFVRNAELLQRLAWTMLLAMLMRAGCFIPLPDIARASLPAASGGQRAEHRSLLQLNDFLSCHHSASTLFMLSEACTDVGSAECDCCRAGRPAAAHRERAAGQPLRGRLRALLRGLHIHGAGGRQRQVAGAKPADTTPLARGRQLGELVHTATSAVDCYAGALSWLSPCWLQHQGSKHRLLIRWVA